MPSKERANARNVENSKRRSTASTVENQRPPARGQLHPAAIYRLAGTRGGALTPRDVLQLHRAVGNRAVGKLLARTAQLQTSHKTETDTGLPENLRAGLEALSGVPLDDVRVHYDSPKPAELQALAYTQGADIHVGPGQEKHLPHEAWHAVQQKRGRVEPTAQMMGASVNDDPGLEKEADVMGEAALRVGVEQPKTAQAPKSQTRQRAGSGRGGVILETLGTARPGALIQRVKDNEWEDVEQRKIWNGGKIRLWLKTKGYLPQSAAATSAKFQEWRRELAYSTAKKYVGEYQSEQQASISNVQSVVSTSQPTENRDKARIILQGLRGRIASSGFEGMSSFEFQLLTKIEQQPEGIDDMPIAEEFQEYKQFHEERVEERMSLPVFAWNFQTHALPPSNDPNDFMYRFANEKDPSTIKPNIEKQKNEFEEIYTLFIKVIEAYKEGQEFAQYEKTKPTQLNTIKVKINALEKLMEAANRHFQGYTQTSPFVSLVGNWDKLKELARSKDKIIQSVIRSTNNLVPTEDFVEFPGRAGGKQRAPSILKFHFPDEQKTLLSPEAVEEFINKELKENETPTRYPTMKSVKERLYIGLGLDKFLYAYCDNPY